MSTYNLKDQLVTLSKTSENGIWFINASNEQEFYSYKALFADTVGLIAAFKKQGIEQGDEVIFQINDLKSFVQCFWSCVLGGFIPVPLNPALNPENREKLINVWNTLDNPWIIASEKVHNTLIEKLDKSLLSGFKSDNCIGFEKIKASTSKAGNVEKLPDIHEQDIALIQFSSGSTGVPKGVTLTHKNLLTNINAIINGSDLKPTDSTLGWMPLTHDLGLIGFHLTPLVCGINQYLIPTEVFVRRPSIWIDKINEHRVTFTASPNFGYKHFMIYHKWEEPRDWDLSCVRRILNGAEPISVDICNDFLERLSDYGLKKEAMFPVYGMAEASLAVAFPQVDQHFEYLKVDRNSLKIGEKVDLKDDGVKYISVGTSVDDCAVRICNDDNIPLDEGICGNIQIKGENVTSRYYNNQEQTAKTILESGWLITGDLGFMHEGKLYITGRAKDIIFSNGLNLYPHDLERVAEEIDGVAEGKVVFTGVFNHKKGADEVICFLVHRGALEGFSKLSKEVKSIINKRISIDIEHVIPINSVPKTTSGKIQRFLLVNQYVNGKYDEVIKELYQNERQYQSSKLPETETQRELLEIWNTVLGTDHVGIENNFFEFGGNSIKASVFIGKASRKFGVDLNIRDLFKNSTVESISNVIESKGKKDFDLIPLISKRLHYPCSAAQKRLFLLHKLNPESVNYNITTIHKISGELDLGKLECIFGTLIQRHPVLRTNFEVVNGEPVQILKEHVEFHVDQVETTKELAIKDLKEYITPYQLDDERLFKVGYFHISESNEYYLVFDIHHILADGYSLNLLVEEFSVLYNDGELTQKEVRYIDYSDWEQSFLKTEDIKRQEEYWLDIFDDEVPVLNFPTDYPRSLKKSETGKTHYFRIEKDIYDLMVRHAEKNGLTFYMQLLAAFYITLHKYGGDEDIVVGTPIMNRPHTALDSVVGPFINSIALRNYPNGEKSLGQFVEEVKENAINAFSNQNYPFELLVEKTQVNRDLDRNPLFDVLFVLQNANDSDLKLSGLTTERVPFSNGFTKFDFNVQIIENKKGFDVSFEYASELFKRETIEQLSSHYLKVLKELCENNVDKKIDEIDLLSEQDKQTIHQKSIGKKLDLSSSNALEKFKKQAKEHAGEVVLKGLEQAITYKKLDSISDYYAGILSKKGVGNGDFVGISFEDALKVPVAMLASWKAGAAFVPIDPDNPQERIEFIAEDAGLNFVFGEHGIGSTESCDIDFGINEQVSSIESKMPGKEDVAYMIYTSGTTGEPKGVQIKHQALVNYTDWLQNEFSIGQEDSSALISSYAFDLGYTSLFGTLLNGGTLHIIGKEDRKEPSFLIDYIVSNELSYIKTTPSQLFTLLNANNSENLSNAEKLRYLFIGGENIRTDDIDKLLKLTPQVEVINHYGPTEATIGCIAQRFSNVDYEEYKKAPSIGLPIQNMFAHILDKHGKEQPNGVVGELFVGGIAITKGYWNRPELNKEKIEGKEYYGTGDLARRNQEGDIILIGRNDDQIKVRGYRVEIGEIEKHLMAIPGVDKALVISKKDDSGNVFLASYYVTGNKVDARDIREQLSNELPEYMVPERIIAIEDIPLTPNGKVDISKLPEGKYSKTIEKVDEAITPSQKKLKGLWVEVLGTSDIHLKDNFFEVGGHSLKANILSSKIHRAFNVDIKLREIFENPTIIKQDKLIATKENNPFSNIPEVGEQSEYELSSSQKRMYVLNQLQPDSTSYNMPGAFILEGEVNVSKMEEAFQKLIQRHESLRTTFHLNKENEVVQKISSDFEFDIDLLGEVEDMDASIKEFIKPFDLAKGPLMRVGLASMVGSTNHLLIFDIHHIISDGSSMGIIIRDFVDLYEGNELAKLRIHYKDYAQWHNDFQSSDYFKKLKVFWTNEFKTEIPLLELPTDYKRPDETTNAGSNFSFSLDKNLTEKLRAFTKEHNTTLFMLLTSIYSLFLNKRTGQNDVVIGTPVAGRPHSDLESMLGVFLNMIPIRLNIDKTLNFDEYQEEVKEQCLKCFDHQDYSFDTLVNELEIPRSTNRNPLFDTMLVVQNMDLGELKTTDNVFKPYEFDLGISQLDLTFVVFENEDTLDFTVEYSTELFRQSTIEKFVQEFIGIAEKVISNTGQLLSEVDLLKEEERKNLVEKAYSNSLERENKTFPELLQASIHAYSDKIALRDEHGEWSYRSLEQYICAYQRSLEELGVQKGDVVGVMCSSSFEMISAIYATLCFGAVYLPLDPDYPEQRLDFMVRDSGAKVVFTNLEPESLHDSVKFIKTAEIDIDSNKDNQELVVNTAPDSNAYIIYTSGTTGTPKGVLVGHRSLYDYILTFNDLLGITSSDCVIQQSSISFDTSVEEIFSAICVGGSIYLVDHRKDLNKIVEAIETGLPTVVSTSPLVLNFLNANVKNFAKLRAVISGGDELRSEYYSNVPENITVWNGYGPTESTVCITYKKIDRSEQEGEMTIGKPLPNRHVLILDKNQNLVPYGMEGELCVDGIGLAKEYLNAPGITASKFINNPFKKGARLYRTGDLVKYNEHGEIVYKGRIDKQVKIRGYRIEVQEIYNVLKELEHIRDAYIQVKNDGESKYLRGYYTVEEGATIEEQDILRGMSEKLPSYMIPGQVIEVDELPINANGKIDENKLPEPKTVYETDTDNLSGSTSEEIVLLEAARKALGTDQLALDRSFFEQGGDSIKAIQLVNDIRSKGYSLEVKDVFTSQYLKDVALRIHKDQHQVDQKEVSGTFDLTPIQKEFFAFEYANPNHYNQSVVLELDFTPDNVAMNKAFAEIIRHHDGLRMAVNKSNGTILPFEKETIPSIESVTVDSKKEFEALCNEIQSSFNIEEGGLIRGAIISFEGKHFLVLIAHHLIVDAMTWRFIVEDLFHAYKAFDNKTTLTLPPKTNSFIDWSNALKYYADSEEVLSKVSYWNEVLSVSEKFLDVSSGTIEEANEIEFEIDEDTTQTLLGEANETYNTSVQDLLLTTLARTVGVVFDKKALTIDVESHGREEINAPVNISRTAGWFTSVYPVKIVSGDSVSNDIIENKDNIHRVPQNGFSYLILKHLSNNLSQNLLESQTEILYNYLGQLDSTDVMEGVKMSSISAGMNIADTNPKEYPVEINQKVENGKLITKINFSKTINTELIEKLKDQFIQQLKLVVEHCIGKEESEVTASDMSFDISNEDFDNIFG